MACNVEDLRLKIEEIDLANKVEILEQEKSLSGDILELENKDSLCKMHLLYQKYTNRAGMEMCFK